MGKQNIKPGLLFNILFSSKAIFIGLIGSITAYFNMYATNYVGLSITAVSMAIMLSKVFDGFSDIGVGILIDHTNTKLGQARPYELGIIGCGIFTILLFSVPKLPERLEIVYVFIVYVILFAVFYTMIQCNEAPYLSNALEDTKDSVKVVSFSSVCSLIFTIVLGVVVPQLITAMGTTREGWSRIAMLLCIPGIFIGLLRFFTIREVRNVKTGGTGTEKRKLKDDLLLLLRNKYAIIFGSMLLLSNIGMALVSSASTYYCLYIMGDLGVASVLAFAYLPAMLVLAVMPVISKKAGTMTVLRVLLILGIIGSLMRFLAPANVICVFLSTALLNIAIYVTWYMASVILIDTMDYGEWKYNERAQGTIASLNGIASKIGLAVGGGLGGVMLGMAGFDGMLDVQPDSAMNMIMVLMTVVPAAFCLVIFILACFYDLDKKMPMIREELAERRAKAENENL